MKTMRISIAWFILMMLLALANPTYAGMGADVKKERDPFLDEFESRVKVEVNRLRKEMEGYRITNAIVDCEIKVDDRFFSSKTSLTVTIPKGKKKFPLFIFEDFEITKIDLTTNLSETTTHTGDATGTKTAGAGEMREYQNLKYTRIVPPLNNEADEYRDKKGIKFEDLHFNDGEKVSRFPHIIWIDLPVDMPDSSLVNAELTITYSGNINRMDQHPFTKSQIFLNGGEFWIPGLFDEKPTIDIKVAIDRPWHIFCQGKLINEKIDEKSAEYEYASSIPQLEPVIIAGDYRVDKEKFLGIDMYGFYLSGDEGGKPVMEKSREYIGFFSDLIGQYPFESFAIMESTAPVGYGYPSFTAIGTLVMRMHFTEPFALGHEILHNWLGNFVETPPEKGNWCEALTTYMSNYHYVEVNDGSIEAMHERQRNLENLSIYLGGKDEFPLKDFEYNKGNIDQVVGYTKGFWLFHEARRMVGDKAFFQALGNFYVKYGGKEASWQNILEEFKIASGDKTNRLDKVFYNFLNELGIPKINIDGVVLHKDIEGETKYRITGNVNIEGKFLMIYDFPYAVSFGDGDVETGKIDLIGETTTFEFAFERMPRSIAFDPEVNVCRYIPEIDRALNLNRFWDNLPAAVIIPKADAPYQELADSVKLMDEKPLIKTFADFKMDEANEMDLLIFAASDDLELLDSFLKQNDLKLPDGFEFAKDGISAGNTKNDGKDLALLITLANPSDGERTVTILYATSSDELKKARGRLRFYGDFGWVLFKEVKAIDRGNFIPENTTLTVKFESMVACKDGMCITEELPR